MIVNSLLKFYSNSPLFIQSNEKLPIKASNSLPEFFQEEFPTFQEFIDVYYQYMSEKTDGFKSISSIKDIDEVGRKYLRLFYQMYAKDMPEFPYMNMADFIRNSKEFYVSRGSEDSFKFLFRIMFGQEIDIKYPKENMFAGSIGKWNQRVSIYVEIEDGEITEELVGRKLLIRALDGSTSSFVVNSYTEVSPNVYEIDVENFIKQNVIDGAKVFAFYSPQTQSYRLRGKVRSGSNKFVILSPGTNFLPGQVYTVDGPDGDIVVRVTATNVNDGIKQLEFVSFAGTTSGEFVRSIKNALVRFLPGTINTYTGYYENTDGFLSNQSKLQDSYFYQVFSYVIKSRVSRELYIDIMDKILHPTGLISFSEYETGSEYDLTLTPETDVNVDLDILDAINIYDEFQRKLKAFRGFSDTINITDRIQIAVKKYFEDEIEITDAGTLDYWKAGEYVEAGYTVGELYTTDQHIHISWP